MTKETNYNENPGASNYGMLSDASDFEEDFMEEEEPSYRAHPAISNSDLKYLHDPRLFQLNKQRKLVEEEEDYHRIGTMVDEFLLNREEFNEKFIQQPEFKFEPSSPNQHGIVEYIMQLKDPTDPTKEDMITAYAQNYSKPSEDKALKMYADLKPYIDFEVKADGKQRYTQQEWDDLLTTVQNAKRNPVVNRFLFEPKETDRVHKHLQVLNMKFHNVLWKGELDLLVLDYEAKIIYNIDLKTTAKPAAWFAYAYNRYKYYRQQALYYYLLQDYIERYDLIDMSEGWKVKTVAIVAEKSNLRKVYPVEIPDEMIKKGHNELVEAAEDINFYNEHGWDEPRSVVETEGYLELDFSEYYDT